MNPPATAPDTPPSPLKGMAVTWVLGFAGTALAVWLLFWVIRTMREHHVGGVWVLAAALVYGAAILGVAFVAVRAGRKVGGVKPTTAARRYHRRFFFAMTAYVLALMTSVSLYAEARPAPWLVWLLALAPALPIIAVIVVMGLYLREETDELERAIMSESGLWATGGLLAIATTWGFLEQFKLVPHVETWAAFPIWALCLGAANAFVRRRYQ